MERTGNSLASAYVLSEQKAAANAKESADAERMSGDAPTDMVSLLMEQDRRLF